MHAATFAAFKDEMSKIAYHSVADIGGLAALAAPTIQKMRGKPMSEKGTHAAELGGLGVLAGSSAHKIYSGMKDAAKGAVKGGKLRAALHAVKHASVKRAALDLWSPSSSSVGGRGAHGVAQAAKKTFTLDHLKGAYQKAGLKPGLGSAVRSAASHIR